MTSRPTILYKLLESYFNLRNMKLQYLIDKETTHCIPKNKKKKKKKKKYF